ncbi:hypothetical protein [Haloplanus halophilus]|uniref:hypothetical protein n=1 Tax=Haloplanus halophilus TaxID=2949993 RepID=UPI00203C1695|nr:hypothetical protein [Haloplanus sp. GDY1]
MTNSAPTTSTRSTDAPTATAATPTPTTGDTGTMEKITRRTVLAGAGFLTASSLSGCLGLLGADPVAADQPMTTPGTATPPSGSGSSASGINDDTDRGHEETPKKGDEQTATPGGPTSLVGPGVLPANVEPERGRGGDEQWQELDYRAYLGPLTAANHGLQDVKVTNAPHADRKNSPLLAYLDIDYLDKPVIESDGTFSITGALHYTHECGYYGINYLDVTNGEAVIALAYTIDETTCTPEYAGRLGARYGDITITGELDPGMNADHLIVTFLSGVHDYKIEESGGDWGGPWSSVVNWHFHV